MVRAIQPHILFNGRNGLPGDFATPEGHLGSPNPWRPWEACITLNDSWGYNDGDSNWKSPGAVVDMLATCAAGRGNLLLNIGPRGDGSVPQASADVITEVGSWLQKNGDCIFDTDRFVYSLTEQGAPGENRSDWCHHGPYTARGNDLFLLLRRPPQGDITLGGVQAQVQRVEQLHNGSACRFVQEGGRVTVALADPATSPATVLRYVCDRPPVVRLCGGLRTPRVAHPPYDPCPSDIAH
jgi:alpha-L-fucosidase